MNCDVIQDLMPLYADGLLSDASRRLVDDHVKDCPGCKARLEAMLQPLEPQPLPREADYQKAILYEKKRERRAALLLIGVVLVGLVAWWQVMEYRFQSHSFSQEPVSEQEALARFPTLVISEEEIALADAVLSFVAAPELAPDAPLVWADVAPVVASVLPVGAQNASAGNVQGNFALDYWHDGLRYIVIWYDHDDDGSADVIQKSVNEPDPGDKDYYDVVMDLSTGERSYTTGRSRKIWFAFLRD